MAFSRLIPRSWRMKTPGHRNLLRPIPGSISKKQTKIWTGFRKRKEKMAWLSGARNLTCNLPGKPSPAAELALAEEENQEKEVSPVCRELPLLQPRRDQA